MIYIKRTNSEEAKQAIEVLAKEKSKNGTYNKQEVNRALNSIFYGKCYICESNIGTSVEIDHLIPHKGDIDLKFEWNNLFWACGHCNNTKGVKYTPILNCNEVHVDKKIAFRKVGFLAEEEKYYFESVGEKTNEIEMTIKLLEAVYYGTTEQKRIEAVNIRRLVRENLSNFKSYIQAYEEETNEKYKKDIRICIEHELQENSAYTAFKRWIIWDNQDKYPEFVEFLHRLIDDDMTEE